MGDERMTKRMGTGGLEERGQADKWVVPEPVRRRTVGIAREFRHVPTRAEAMLWEELRNRRLDGIKFRRQQPIGPFVVDFYAAEHRLVLEIDGGVHHSQQERDLERQSLLESLGLRVLRIPTETVEQNLAAALTTIRAAL